MLADVLRGNSRGNILEGGSGADVLDGGGGVDNAAYNFAAAGLTAIVSTPGNNTGDAAGDTYISIESLIGSWRSPTLSVATTILTFCKVAAEPTFWRGRGGGDFAAYFSSPAGVTADLSNPANNTGEAAGDTYTSIENIFGSRFNDVLTGDGSNNNLRGSLGTDVLNGGGGHRFCRLFRTGTAGVTADQQSLGRRWRGGGRHLCLDGGRRRQRVRRYVDEGIPATIPTRTSWRQLPDGTALL